MRDPRILVSKPDPVHEFNRYTLRIYHVLTAKKNNLLIDVWLFARKHHAILVSNIQAWRLQQQYHGRGRSRSRSICSINSSGVPGISLLPTRHR